MLTRRELKLNSKAQLKGNWGKSILVLILIYVITLALSFDSFAKIPAMIAMYTAMFEGNMLEAQILGAQVTMGLFNYIMLIVRLLVFPALTLGYLSFFLALSRRQSPDISTLFSKFNLWAKAFVLNLLIGIFVFLWALLFWIPGIIAAYRYRQALYILIDNPEISPIDAIRKSKEMMKGHKGELFVLDLSFIGWSILASITFYLGCLWLIPYMQTTYSNYYDALNGRVFSTGFNSALSFVPPVTHQPAAPSAAPTFEPPVVETPVTAPEVESVIDEPAEPDIVEPEETSEPETE